MGEADIERYFSVVVEEKNVPMTPVAKFLVPDRRDIVDSGCRSGPPCGLPGLYGNPIPESTIFPQSGTKNIRPQYSVADKLALKSRRKLVGSSE